MARQARQARYTEPTARDFARQRRRDDRVMRKSIRWLNGYNWRQAWVARGAQFAQTWSQWWATYGRQARNALRCAVIVLLILLGIPLFRWCWDDGFRLLVPRASYITLLNVAQVWIVGLAMGAVLMAGALTWRRYDRQRRRSGRYGA